MTAKGTLPFGVRKHIRGQKARIRREFLTDEARVEEINKLYEKFSHLQKDRASVKEEKKVEKKPVAVKTTARQGKKKGTSEKKEKVTS